MQWFSFMLLLHLPVFGLKHVNQSCPIATHRHRSATLGYFSLADDQCKNPKNTDFLGSVIAGSGLRSEDGFVSLSAGAALRNEAQGFRK